jgi:pyroglutamyl-peptidase
MRILVQGFGPFGRFRINPSELLVRALNARTAKAKPAQPGQPADTGQLTGTRHQASTRQQASIPAWNPHELHTEVLQTTAARVAEAVPALMEEHRPDVWLGVGLAAGRFSLSVEAVAVNLGCRETEDPEADTEPWPRRPVSDHGPAAYLTSLPAEAILSAWRDADIPGYLSYSAGTYLCNMSFYLAAQAAERLGTGCLVGFLHVPLLPQQVERPATEPSMSFALQQAGLDTLLDVCRTTTHSAHPTSPVTTGRIG